MKKSPNNSSGAVVNLETRANAFVSHLNASRTMLAETIVPGTSDCTTSGVHNETTTRAHAQWCACSERKATRAGYCRLVHGVTHRVVVSPPPSS